MTASATEYALADLAIRLGAGQVAGWSPAEQDLAAAAPAAPGDREGVAPGDREGVAPGDREGVFPGDREGVALGDRDGVAGLRARIRAGEDPLGQAFCRIRPPEQRRGAGQTFTPASVVDSMISWAGRALAPARVDP